MDREDLAWAAGLYEGEGSIHARKDRPGSGIMSLHITDEDVIRRFCRVLGVGKVYGPYAHNGSAAKNPKPMWVWQTARFEHIQAVVAMLWSWLCERRRAQASRVLRQMKAGSRSRQDRSLVWRMFGKARRDLTGPEHTAYTRLVRKG